MNSKNNSLETVTNTCVGISFILFPIIFIFAFATHPDIFNPRFLGSLELINRVRNNELLHFGHALVTLCTGLLIVVAIHFMNKLKNTSSAWLGFIGGVIAVIGALMLAADKGALCLTMSALESLGANDFNNMMPGLLAIFAKKGWMILIWGLLFLPIGFLIQAIGLLKSKQLAKWQSILFIIGVLFIGTPDGVEIINLTASILIAIAFIPYGIKLIKNRTTGWNG